MDKTPNISKGELVFTGLLSEFMNVPFLRNGHRLIARIAVSELLRCFLPNYGFSHRVIFALWFTSESVKSIYQLIYTETHGQGNKPNSRIKKGRESRQGYDSRRTTREYRYGDEHGSFADQTNQG